MVSLTAQNKHRIAGEVYPRQCAQKTEILSILQLSQKASFCGDEHKLSFLFSTVAPEFF